MCLSVPVPTLVGGRKLAFHPWLPTFRVPELAGLLDPATDFPTSPWTGPALAQLAPLGLRTSVTTHTLLQAARHVEELMTAAEPMAWARCAFEVRRAGAYRSWKLICPCPGL
jgi:hypothetical protein